jgi:hypothetical protein
VKDTDIISEEEQLEDGHSDETEEDIYADEVTSTINKTSKQVELNATSSDPLGSKVDS